MKKRHFIIIMIFSHNYFAAGQRSWHVFHLCLMLVYSTPLWQRLWSYLYLNLSFLTFLIIPVFPVLLWLSGCQQFFEYLNICSSDSWCFLPTHPSTAWLTCPHPLQRLSLPPHRGTVVYTGCTQWEYIGRRNLKGIPAMMHHVPRRIAAFKGIRLSYVASHCSAAHTIFITEEGKVFSLGEWHLVLFCCTAKVTNGSWRWLYLSLIDQWYVLILL